MYKTSAISILYLDTFVFFRVFSRFLDVFSRFLAAFPPSVDRSRFHQAPIPQVQDKPYIVSTYEPIILCEPGLDFRLTLVKSATLGR